MQYFSKNDYLILPQDRMSISVVLALVFSLVMAAGCDECKNSSDCSAGKICVNGDCVLPSSDTDTDTDTDADSDTDSDTDTDTDECVNPETDCPGDSGECAHYECQESMCVLVNEDDGDSCTFDSNDCTDDVCVEGTCTAFPLSGVPCADDGNDCTSDVCDNGVCGVALIDYSSCTVDTNPCIDNYCLSGACVHPAVLDNTPCDDTSWCNGPETCQAGVCQVAAGPCATFIECQDGTCVEPVSPDPEGTCDLQPVTDGDSCDDGLFCNGTDTCQTGVCDHTGWPCTSVSGDCEYMDCSEATSSCSLAYWPPGYSCADAVLCDGSEVCDGAGNCDPGSPPCSTFSDCTIESCTEDTTSYTCGAPIDMADGSTCTTVACSGTGTHQCLSGACLAAENPPCSLYLDEDFCTSYLDCSSSGSVANCTIPLDLGYFVGGSLSCSGSGTSDSSSFSNEFTQNEVTNYTGACAGNFTGGEEVYLIDVPAGASYSIGFSVDAQLPMPADLKGLLVTDACNPVGNCISSSTYQTSPFAGEWIDATAPSTGEHYFVIDGLDGGRGFGNVTLLCN